jgi:serine phosphatase RsbU (regulator of sigma subunit)
VNPIEILIIEDSDDDAQLLRRLLKKNGLLFESVCIQKWDNLLTVFEMKNWDLVLSDFTLPGFNGMDALKYIRKINQDIPFIILSGNIGEEIAVEVMRAGANDYIMKDNMTRLVPAIMRELREYEGRKNQKEIHQKLKEKEEQFRITHLIQQSLFPREPLNLFNFDIAGRSFPAEAAGGDYYDFISIDEQRFGIVIGDVTGHGIGPALLMTTTRAYLRAFCKSTIDSGEIMAMTNQVLFQDVEEGRRFVTLFLGILNPSDSTLTYASAGHHNGYIMTADGKTKKILKSTGPPLGILPDTKYESSEKIFLESGDTVILLTDGITDAVCGEDPKKEQIFGEERAIRTIHENRSLSSQEIVNKLHEQVVRFSNNFQEDDITAVIMKAF